MSANKLGAALVATGLTFVCALSGCSNTEENDRPRGEVVFGEAGDFPQNLFPIIGAGFSNPVYNILIRILPAPFRILPDFSLEHDPELFTEEPTLDEVEGKQVNVYTINPDAVWSDGTPITVDDFAFVAKVQDEEFVAACADSGIVGTFGYDQIESIKGSEAGRIVTVTYARPFADWRGLFTLLPAHLMDNDDPVALCATITTGWPAAQGLPEDISGGPWQLEAEDIDAVSQTVTLTPNENYWGDQPNLLRLIHQTIGNEPGAAVSGLANGELQMIYSAPEIDMVGQVAALQPDVASSIDLGLIFEHLDLNTRNVHLADPNVRRAFALALDRQEIVDQTVGQMADEAEVLNNRIFFNNQPYYQDNAPVEYNTQDPGTAKALLEESGYVLGADGIYLHPQRGRLSLQISTLLSRQREDTIAVIIPQAAEAGIEIIARVDPEFFSSADSPTSLEAGGFDIALFAWFGGPFPSSNAAIYQSLEAQGGLQGQNYTRGGDPRVDSLFEELKQEPDPDAQAELGNRIDALLWEHLYTIPLYQDPQLLAFVADLDGVEPNVSQAGPLWNSEKWTLSQS